MVGCAPVSSPRLDGFGGALPQEGTPELSAPLRSVGCGQGPVFLDRLQLWGRRAWALWSLSALLGGRPWHLHEGKRRGAGQAAAVSLCVLDVLLSERGGLSGVLPCFQQSLMRSPVSLDFSFLSPSFSARQGEHYVLSYSYMLSLED